MVRNITILLGLVLSINSTSTAQLSINEVMASNTATLMDEAGEYDDWIEIYNAGGQAINLAGYYVSDDPLEVQKWQIPLDDPLLTTVPAGGFLLLWADKDPEQGPHHIDFKLSAAGEDLLLTHTNGSTLIDQLSFSNQAADISYGRSTDGGNDFQLFSNPTPGESNNGGSGVLTFPVSFSVPVATDAEDAVENETGAVSLEGFALQLGEDFSGPTTVGLRFQLDLPANAIINQAYIRFRAAGNIETDPANWTIKAQSIADAPVFTTANNNVSGRATTSTAIDWTVAAWDIENNGGLQWDNSPNLGNLIQEVTGLNGWNANNSIVFVITGTGARNAFSGQSEAFKPELFIEAGIPYPSNPITGVYINEVAAAGTPHVDQGGEREDWIELYNANNFAVDLSGLYLTDDYNDLDKSRIPDNVILPANGFLTFFADRDEEDGPLHTNFNLRSKGEEVALAMQLSTGLVIIDSIGFDDVPFMSTYGRLEDGGLEWVHFGAPTPDASNNGANLYLAPPSFTLANGIYQETQNTQITHELPGVEIRYTTDANLPDINSTLYNNAITIFGTQNIRAMAFKAGYEPSQVENAAYIINKTPNLPIVYLTTEPANFFDNEIGIYVDGTNGIQLYCAPYPVNWAQDWERPVNVKLFLPDGTEAFDVNAGVKISGVCSRNNAMKSLAISLKEKEFGNGELGYRLFDNRDHDNFLRFKLRNSGQDYNRMGFRDLLNQALIIDKIDVETQNGQPVLVYLNGQFWGIHNIREKYTGEFFEDNFGIDKDKIDIIKSPGLPWMELKQGSLDTFNTLFNFVNTSSLTDDTNFQHFESQVDLNAFLNYWISMIYLANTDWPANNLTVWREQKAGAKWRYCVTDTDGSTNNVLSDLSLPEYNTIDSLLSSAGATTYPYHEASTLFIRKLLEREDYRHEFIQRACSFIGILYNEDRVNYFTDSIRTLYQPNVAAHLSLWGNGQGAFGGLGASIEEDSTIWEGWIDAYKDFFVLRPEYFRNHLNEYYGLNDTYNLTFNVDASTPGYVVVNTNEMKVPANFVNPYFKTIPLKVRAIPKSGATFSHWLETGDTNPVLDFVSEVDASLTPIFNCLLGSPGTACDDGEACTTNDVVTEDCECKGTIEDYNMDGIANQEDCDFLNAVDPDIPNSVLQLFPNPAKNSLTLQLENQTIKAVEVFNSSGILIFAKNELSTSSFSISVMHFPQGLYFIKTYANGGDSYFGSFSVLK